MTKRSICDLCLSDERGVTLAHQCDFCGKLNREVQYMFYGDSGKDICSECLLAGVGVLKELATDKRQKPDGEKPQETST